MQKKFQRHLLDQMFQTKFYIFFNEFMYNKKKEYLNKITEELIIFRVIFVIVTCKD